MADFPLNVALPPLTRTEVRPPLVQRVLHAGLVVFVHLVLGYAALYWSVKQELIALPPSISVRLLPLAEAPKPTPQPPKPTPQRPVEPVHKVVPVQPILTSKAAQPTSEFAVAPQPSVPTPVASAPAAPVAAAAPAVVAARFDADYLHNPKPVYPAFSRRAGEEGKVLLKVRVSPQGTALEVSLSKSSGFPRLDAAAQDAVSRWRFVPARRGDEPVESSVIVPVSFTLD